MLPSSNTARVGAAKRWYDKPHKHGSLLGSLEVAVADPTPAAQQRIVGVEVGQRYLAVATDLQNHMAFFAGAQVRSKADHSSACGSACRATALARRHDGWSWSQEEREGCSRLQQVAAGCSRLQQQPPHQSEHGGGVPAQ